MAKCVDVYFSKAMSKTKPCGRADFSNIGVQLKKVNIDTRHVGILQLSHFALWRARIRASYPP
jgi:hypothetical protein